MKTLAFFNNKGGVGIGKTSLVYHLAWMYSELGRKVVAADLDPQANLTSMFLAEDRLEQLWPEGEHPQTVLGAIYPIMRGIGDLVEKPHVESITENLGLVPGDLGLSSFEDRLSGAWPECSDGDEAAFRAFSSLYRLIHRAARQRKAELILIDVGPNLGAINRAAIISARHVVVPLAPDLYSLQGLRNLGSTLRKWRGEWQERLKKNPDADLNLPEGAMQPLGYVLMQHAVRKDRPVKAYEKWIRRIPAEYRKAVLDVDASNPPETMKDEHCLAMLKHYRSLMPMAMEAQKPMFSLKPADGAIGSHMAGVSDCHKDFKSLALRIAERCNL